MRVFIDVAGDVQLERELLRVSGRITNAKPAFERILDDLAGIEREQFDSEGGRSSGGWPPLAASTLAAKRAKGLDERILRATGALVESLTSRSVGGDALRTAGADEMIFGTTVAYARFHQRGQGVPRRRPVELRESDRRHVVKVLQRYLMTGAL